MSTRSLRILTVLLILASFLTGIALYPLLPDRIASHWDASGTVNGTMGKFWGLFLLPLIALGILILFMVIPRIDPLRDNIQQFRREYNALVAVITAVLVLIYASTLAWNLGVQFDMSRFAVAVVGLLLFFIGSVLPKMKRNWFMGIRTPWTLSSDTVWAKTHEQGGLVFRIAGILALLAILLPGYGVAIAVVPILVGTLWLVVYSYLEYRKERAASSALH